MASKQRTLDARPSRRRQLSRWQRDKRRQRTALFTGLAALLLILAIPLYGYYTTFIAPPRQWVVRVNNVTFTMGYLVKILRMFQGGSEGSTGGFSLGTSPFQIVQVLSESELIRQGGPRYNITVTQEDISQEVRTRILGTQPEGTTTPPDQLEREFRERYRQYLNIIRLKEAEHRRVVEYDLYRERMRELVGQKVPAVQPQVHLYRLVVDSPEKAREARKLYETGTPFGKLVDDLSVDTESEVIRKQGEVGWLPKGVMQELDDLIAKLEPGKLSEDITLPTQDPQGRPQYLMYLVTEKADAREVDQRNLELLKTRALQEWLNEERGRNRVETNFDSDKYAWVVKQLRLSQTQQQQQ